MPNKTVPGYTQVPVVGADLVSVLYERLPASILRVVVIYEIRDNVGGLRGVKTASSTVALASYPLSAAATVALANTAEGT